MRVLILELVFIFLLLYLRPFAKILALRQV